ncbi:hypothetical protein ACF3NF_03385 [Anaerococcus martiniensis]|uniref:hypothetical protein n=1 Tax=Anaerococcus sp. WGS1579 TaxID=3366809 RepID=UPI00372D641A
MNKIKLIGASLLAWLVFCANTSYASEDNITDYSKALELSLPEKDTTYSADDLKKLIDQTVTSVAYQTFDDYFKNLYHVAIENAHDYLGFNSEDDDATTFAYHKFINEIEKIDQLKDMNLDDVDTDSVFYKNPKYTIAYLNLDKSLQEELDNMKTNDRNFLTISELEASKKYILPIFFYEFPYQFMHDKDKDGMVGEWQAETEKLFKNNSLTKAYRKASPDQRRFIKELDADKNGFIDLIEIKKANLVYEDDLEWVRNFIPDKDKESFSKIEEDPTSKTPITKKEEPELTYPETKFIYDPVFIQDDEDIKIVNKDSTSKYKYDSIFYIKNRTSSFYENLTDEQRLELDAMNTDGDAYLSIEELEKSENYNLPIDKSHWLYSFMYDKNNDGLINEDDRNPYPKPYEENFAKEDENLQANDDLYSSVFYKNEKTRDAYLNLTDEKKKELDEMNTDGKYPLTLDEVKASGKFSIPIKKDRDWIYPFMVDRNNNGEVGEDYEIYENVEKEPSTEKLENKKDTQNPDSRKEIVTNPVSQETTNPSRPILKETTTSTIIQPNSSNVKAASNVKTGVSNLNLIYPVIFSSLAGLIILKKYK